MLSKLSSLYFLPLDNNWPCKGVLCNEDQISDYGLDPNSMIKIAIVPTVPSNRSDATTSKFQVSSQTYPNLNNKRQQIPQRQSNNRNNRSSLSSEESNESLFSASTIESYSPKNYNDLYAGYRQYNTVENVPNSSARLNSCSEDSNDYDLIRAEFEQNGNDVSNDNDLASIFYSLKNLMKVSYCTFCKKNKEHVSFYKSHVLKDCQGKLSCPVLLKYVCPVCNCTGEKAHTKKYCPVLKLKKAQTPARNSNIAKYNIVQ